MIRADLELLADLTPEPGARVPAPLRQRARARANPAKTSEQTTFPSPAPIPAWARASGRAGEGASLFAAGALRARLALKSAAATAKILRLNTDEGALRDLRFAAGGPLGLAATLLSLWRDLAGRPPSLDPGRLAVAAGRLDLALVDANSLAERLQEFGRAGDPVSAAAKTAAVAFSSFPDAAAPPAEILAHWLFDTTIAIRLRWPRPLPLLATTILDPTLRLPGAGRRPLPGDPAWANAAAGAIGLAAASALALAAELSRRSAVLLAVAPKLRSKPAARIVDFLLAEDCVTPAEAARHAPMTDRAARRLFDRLVTLSAARELTGRPAFRLYGL